MSQDCCNKKCSEMVSQSEEIVSSDLRTIFKVRGMDCADEVSAIQRALKTDLIKRIETNIVNETVTVYHDRDISKENIQSLIEKTKVKVLKTDQVFSFYEDHVRAITLVTISGLSFGLGLITDWRGLFTPFAMKSFYFISILFAGIIIFPKAWRSLRKVHLDMNVLMTVAVFGAVAINELSEAASVIFLFSLAELLEAMSVSRARKAIRDVLKVAPQKATLIGSNNDLKIVDVSTLKIGDLILVRPGENIPIDGDIINGNSSINQASLTGESIPVLKKVGESIWAGTINETGALKIRVTKEYNETKIAKIIALIEEAQSQKAPSQSFVDKFSSIYTPSVMALAILVALVPPLVWSASWDVWIYKSLVLLVIGCPCALVIATPVSVVSGLTSLARRGVLVKGGVHLESLGKLKAIALDKTGTVTIGNPKVIEVRSFSDLETNEILKITASLESMSGHPLAKAIVNYVSEKKISYLHPTDFKSVTGKGVIGEVENHWYFAGNHVMAHELGICTPEIETYLNSVEEKAMSVIIVGHKPHGDCRGQVIAVFAIGDQIRPDIQNSIQDLHRSGIKLVAMLSGDNQKTVDSVAKEIGIDFAKGALLPEQKVEEIKKLLEKYRYVGMVGDGVNDTPALAHATLGIAMGAAGSDSAIETADVALMKDDISELPKAIKHGKNILHIIQFNIFFALALKAVFFFLTFMGMTNLWLAVAADMGASLVVILNSLRLLKVDTH